MSGTYLADTEHSYYSPRILMHSRVSPLCTNFAKLMNMGDNFDVVIDIEHSYLRITPGSSNLHKFQVMLKHLVSSSAFPSILLALCLATSAVNALIHTSMLFEWLAFFFFVCCGCVFSRLIVTALVFVTERYFMMRTDKTLYFIYALRKSLEYFFCSSSILFSWLFFVKSQMNNFAIHFVTSTLATFMIANGMWMFKILILKVLDCRFHDKNFFQNMQNQISHEYVLQTLLRPTREFNDSNNSTVSAQLKRIKGSFANMLRLVCTRLHTVCDALDSCNSFNEDQVESDISMIFKNLTNNEHRDIRETDLLCVMKTEEITDVLKLFEGAAETKSISAASLRKWMVKLSNERKLVVHFLQNTSTVINELNIVVLVNIFSLGALAWYLLMGFGTTRFIVYITSDHLLLLVFILGSFCKMICEGIMLAIVMHPFDIGDLCIIDNEQLVVEKIGLISTDFLKDNNWKVQCLNSVLLTKSISNLNRSSELTDNFEILISSTTPSETIAVLKLQIEELLRSNPGSWHAEHCFNILGIDDVKAKYNLLITHVRKIQSYNEKKYQRSEFVQKLGTILKEVNIQNFTIQ